MDFWLVVWNMAFICPSIGNNNPNWLVFFRGVGIPPTRFCSSQKNGGVTQKQRIRSISVDIYIYSFQCAKLRVYGNFKSTISEVLPSGYFTIFYIAMENGPFIDDVPIKTSIYKGFSMAMLNNQMVNTTNQCGEVGLCPQVSLGDVKLRVHREIYYLLADSKEISLLNLSLWWVMLLVLLVATWDCLKIG